jgi:1-acyl-sn-glycerol-3-phosphate acyltransferase
VTVPSDRRDPGARDGQEPPVGPPGPAVAPWRRSLRYWATWVFVWLAVRVIVRFRVAGLERFPSGPCLICANHQSWTDPVFLMAGLPPRPRLYLFGPKEEDMGVGARNRVMSWIGNAVPFRPGKDDLLDTTRRVSRVFEAGASLGIFGEGRIHAREGELLPLSEGAAYFALRSKVPIVPVGLVGTSWIGVGRTVRLRVGEPIVPEGRPSREAVEAMTARLWCAIFELTRDAPQRPPPGRFGRWLTEVFNDWPEGDRPERTPGAVGPLPPGVPVEGPQGPCGGAP